VAGWPAVVSGAPVPRVGRFPRVGDGTDMRILVRRERPSAGAQLCGLEDGWRYQLPATNTPSRQLDFLKSRHRAHARVEDRVRSSKDTGLDHLPSVSMAPAPSQATEDQNSAAAGRGSARSPRSGWPRAAELAGRRCAAGPLASVSCLPASTRCRLWLARVSERAGTKWRSRSPPGKGRCEQRRWSEAC
jgi:hypothetical protein